MNGQQQLRNRVATTAYFESYDPLNHDLTDAQSLAHYSYDVHGNVVEYLTEIPELYEMGNGNDFKLLTYDFDLLSGNVNKVVYQPGDLRDHFEHRYAYDNNNRLIAAYSSTNGILWERDARYSYYRHGPLMRTELGEERVQGLDYAYTINGWLVGVNGINVNQATADMGRDGSNTGPHKWVAQDAFGFALAYFENSYTPIKTGFIHSMKLSNLTAATNHRDMYNGNISGMSTSMLDESEVGVVTHYHRYRYDQLNRITSSRVGNLFSSDGALPGMYTDQSSTTYSYDANGNILTLDRYDLNGVQFDDFTYHYGTANNRLGHVSDAILSSAYANDLENGQSSGNYSYDADGNLISDAQEGINSITWNVQGKVSKIDKAAGPDLEFRYDPMGQRQMKIVKNGTLEPNWIKNYYIRDPQGNVMATYTLRYEEIDPQARPDEYKQLFSLNEQHVYGSSRLGVLNVNELLYETEIHVTAVGGNGELKEYSYVNDQITYMGVLKTTTRGSKTYELTNHLGNVMSTISDRKIPVGSTITHFLPDVDTYQDYFPFGMVMSERSGSEMSAGYRYGFQGHEKDDELKGNGNSLDFGARMFDSRLARWFAIDPLYYKYPNHSPYIMVGNSPLRYVDLDGRDIYEVSVDGTINHIVDETMKEDVFYMVDMEGNRDEASKESFDKGVVYAWIEEDGLEIQVKGDDNTSRLYEFLACNTAVEFSEIKTGEKGENGTGWITSSYSEYEDSRMIPKVEQLIQRPGVVVRTITHSHPNGYRWPSGADRESLEMAEKMGRPNDPKPAGEYGDVLVAKQLLEKFTEFKKPLPEFFIYRPMDNERIPYDENTRVPWLKD